MKAHTIEYSIVHPGRCSWAWISRAERNWREERNTQTGLKEMAVHKEQIHHTLQFTSVPTEPGQRAVNFPL
ncbi:hypothetical protein PHYPO_G00205480 [Pangasianodon hypophthalmus]|uniref:Uncharacterized protein n=1 Tax=Pangasianodon hypophthalmus TaxID=310915 RepID=A0A5N5PCT9_PANHP|nr:hypothetical protein PHYPO_G00205480 [Pangasianodon hypophthalmus]